MSVREQITERYRQNTLKRIQRRVDKMQRSKQSTSKSRLKQWLLAADQVEQSNRRILSTLLVLLLLLPAAWFLHPLLLEAYFPQPQQKGTPQPQIAKPTPQPRTTFEVHLELQQNQPETMQILEKIKQRPLPIEIKPVPGTSEQLLLVDTTPSTHQEAEQLKNIYTQLFGVEAKIIESTIESTDDARI